MLEPSVAEGDNRRDNVESVPENAHARIRKRTIKPPGKRCVLGSVGQEAGLIGRGEALAVSQDLDEPA
jgi:hypothetical protein